MPRPKGSIAPNFIDRTGHTYGKLTVLARDGKTRWLCLCACGNRTSVLSTNFANYTKGNRGCRHCGPRINIKGERSGLLVAIAAEEGPITGRAPLWTFQCDCGATTTGLVREFRFGRLRSCGCIGNAHHSWSLMLARCYDPKNNRYQHYGARGIKVCDRWHSFENFLADMSERPKRHNLSRLRCEEDYSPDNCIWEHITKNTADTCYGKPTKPGLAKGAVDRRIQA